MFYILGVVAVLWGISAGRISLTMSNGPREGTRYAAFVVAALAGLFLGGLVGVGTSFGLLAGVLVGTLTALGGTAVGFLGAMAITD